MIDYVISAIFKLKVLFGVSIKVCKILICSAKIQRLVPQKSNGCKCIVKTILFVYTKSLSGQSWYVGWIVGFVVTCCSTWRTRLHADSEEFTSTVSRQWRCFTLQGRNVSHWKILVAFAHKLKVWMHDSAKVFSFYNTKTAKYLHMPTRWPWLCAGMHNTTFQHQYTQY